MNGLLFMAATHKIKTDVTYSFHIRPFGFDYNQDLNIYTVASYLELIEENTYSRYSDGGKEPGIDIECTYFRTAEFITESDIKTSIDIELDVSLHGPQKFKGRYKSLRELHSDLKRFIASGEVYTMPNIKSI